MVYDLEQLQFCFLIADEFFGFSRCGEIYNPCLFWSSKSSLYNVLTPSIMVCTSWTSEYPNLQKKIHIWKCHLTITSSMQLNALASGYSGAKLNFDLLSLFHWYFLLTWRMNLSFRLIKFCFRPFRWEMTLLTNVWCDNSS